MSENATRAARRRARLRIVKKTDPEQFGGGRPAAVGTYTADGISRLMCSRAGCDRAAHATWGACADGNVQRPLCPECDVELNARTLAFFGDPDRVQKMADYAVKMERDCGRPLHGGEPLYRPLPPEIAPGWSVPGVTDNNRRMFGDAERTPEAGHTNLPITAEQVLAKVACGLPVYMPTDPVDVDQAPYRAFIKRAAAPTS